MDDPDERLPKDGVVLTWGGPYNSGDKSSET